MSSSAGRRWTVCRPDDSRQIALQEVMHGGPFVLWVEHGHTIMPRVLGRWSEDDYELFEARMRSQTSKIMVSEPHFHLIIDISQYRIQTPDMRDQFAALIKWGVQNGLVGGVNLVSPGFEFIRRLLVLARGKPAIEMLRFYWTARGAHRRLSREDGS